MKSVGVLFIITIIIIIVVVVVVVVVIIIIIIIIIITSETGITIYNYKSHRKLVNVKVLKKKIDQCV